MPFELDSAYLVYLFAAASVVLIVEAAYLLCFSTASYRSRINRRLRLMRDQPDRESVLIQLRRERGLTSGGLYGLPILSLNRLILQSGVTIGVRRGAASIAGVALFAFGMAADEITYGADLETAMRNLAFRVGQDDLPLFVTAVAIQGSTGGNLSEILENLSSTIRQRFKMRRKIKALAAEGKFSAFFLSGLPVAIFFLLGTVAPDFYGSVWSSAITKVGLGVAGAWMMLGNIVMYRMVNFRI